MADLPLSRWPTFISTDIDDQACVWLVLNTREGLGHSEGGSALWWSISWESFIFAKGPDVRRWRSSCSPRLVTRELWHLQRVDEVDRWCNLSKSSMTFSRVSLFLWKVGWSRLPARALLRARRMDIPTTCPSCESVDETMDYGACSLLLLESDTGLATGLSVFRWWS